MAGQATESNENQESTPQVDPWEAAFAAVSAESSVGAEAASDTGGIGENESTDEATSGVSRDGDTTSNETGNNDTVSGGLGESDNSDGASDQGFGESYEPDTELTEDYIRDYRESVRQEVTQQAIDVVAQEYIRQGIRHTNGKLGADINQPDICKRDRDGVPRFYNPETGREFTGDNPRRQALEYCDDYNKELAKSFNESCDKYVEKLMAEREPEIAVLEFNPTYDSLDPIRKSMFDSLIEDYEIVKDGEVVGYSCDLNKALQAVNRQVRIIQENYRTQQSQPPHQEEPKGPALDIKASAAAGKDKSKKPDFKSVAEAMEWEQDRLLESLKPRK